MRAPSLLSKPLALLSALLLMLGTILAYLLRRLAQSRRALASGAGLAHAGEQLSDQAWLQARRTNDLAALQRVAEVMGSAHDPHELLSTIAGVAR